MKFNLKLNKFNMLLLAVAMTGCSSMSGKSTSSIWDGFGKKAETTELSRTQALMRAGAEYLEKGDLDNAQTVFNTALKFDLKNAPLHFFNALTYQLKYEKGDADSYALAEAGYKTAVGLDSTLDVAHLQLGRLYMSSKKFTEAKKSFALAVDAKVKAPQEALFGMAQASLYSGDAATATWATAELDKLAWKDARLYRMKAFQAAVAKKPELVKTMLAQYTAMEGNKDEARYVSGRLDQLLATKTSFRPGSDVMLAQAKTDDAKPEAKADAKEEAKDDKKADAGDPNQRKNWFRCDLRPGPVFEKDAVPMNKTFELPANEENITAPTLPAPCAGENPPVAIIEVTMIRTEESLQKSFGINLMDGLTLSKSLSFSAMGDTANQATQSANNLTNAGTLAADATGAVTGGFLSYNLNIANSLYTKNEVIARPTLSAIDRLPSIFFSGATYSIKVGGVNSATLVDKPVGVALSVTPTFLEDDKILLSIRASRSFIEETANSNVALMQTRNAVNATALVTYGQTFVLNGLVEREIDSMSNGVPFLQDIPILQYFFKRSVTLDYNRQILTLVTVRRLVDSDDSIAKAKNKTGLMSSHKMSDQVQEYLDLQNNKPVLDEVLAGLRADNGLYTKLRQRDLIQESYGSKTMIKRLIEDIKDMAYF
ncbi:Type II/III secretion system [Burkholderiaceae bacterium]